MHQNLSWLLLWEDADPSSIINKVFINIIFGERRADSAKYNAKWLQSEFSRSGSHAKSFWVLLILTFSLVSQQALKKWIWLPSAPYGASMETSRGYSAMLGMPSYTVTVKVTVLSLTTPARWVFSHLRHLCREIRSASLKGRGNTRRNELMYLSLL